MHTSARRVTTAGSGTAPSLLHHAGLAEDINLQLLALREFTPQLLATGHAGLVAAALRRVPDGVRDNLPALSALEAQVLRSLRRYDAAKAAADRALAQRPPRGDRHPDRELQADLAILEVWQARRGWRPATAAVSHAAEPWAAATDAGDRTADPRHLRHLPAPQRLADAGPRGARSSGPDDLDLADRTCACRRPPTPRRWSCPRLTVRGARTPGLPRAGDLRLPERVRAPPARACAVHEQAMLAPDATRSRAFLVRGWSRFQALDLDGAEQDLAASAAGPPDPLDPFDVVYGETARGQPPDGPR